MSNNYDLLNDNPLLAASVAVNDEMKKKFVKPEKCKICEEADYGQKITGFGQCERCRREFRTEKYRLKDIHERELTEEELDELENTMIFTYGEKNRMIPSIIPDCLKDLTLSEQCAIKLACDELRITH